MSKNTTNVSISLKKENNRYAKFWYKGSHSHPVRRTILINKINTDYIEGYELREGNKVRKLSKSSLKKYCRNKIACNKNLRLDNPRRKQSPNKSTLRIYSNEYIVNTGI